MSTAPTTLHAPPGAAAVSPSGARKRRVVTAWAPRGLLAVAVLLGVAARLHSPSTLWLDEALSVTIANRPVPQLLHALRADGSPPLYYLLLHGWVALFGDAPTAVRALSTVFSVATLAPMWCAGRRLGGPATARAALLLLAVSPFAVRYATEARMYALVQLLTALGLLAVLRALARPTVGRLAAVAGAAGLLALTHYWTLFLLATAAAVLAGLAWRGPHRRAAARVLLALPAGAVLFLPWLPTFAFQVRHTGAPWAATPHPVDAWYTLTGWAGGGQGPAVVLTLLLAGLALLAVAGHARPGGVLLGRPLDRTAVLLLLGSVGSLELGLLTGSLLASGYSLRYSSAAFVPALLLAALGVRVLPHRARVACLAVVTVCGLVGALPQLTSTGRTQAAKTARVLRAGLSPGDVVAYCPDQLGPAVSRLLPAGTDQVVYPTFGSPHVVDWVDYARRNAAASPSAFARQLVERTAGSVWLVGAGGYRTLEGQCEQLAFALEGLRGQPVMVQQQDPAYAEQQAVRRYPRRDGR